MPHTVALAAEDLIALGVSSVGHRRELLQKVDLARAPLGRTGDRQKACDLLTPVYGWFTGGFDTADLKEAKALLDDLGERRPPAGSVHPQAVPPERPQVGLDRGGEADAQRVGGDRVADADLGELRDRVNEERQVVEVEVVAGVDAEPGLRGGLGRPHVAFEQRSGAWAAIGVGVGAGIQLDFDRRRLLDPGDRAGSGSRNRLTRAPLACSAAMIGLRRSPSRARSQP